MFGELSEDQSHITMPFEDVHRLVTTMRMTEVILNERIQNKRKAELEFLTSQLDASECNDMPALLAELEKTKAALRRKYSFVKDQERESTIQVGLYRITPCLNRSLFQEELSRADNPNRTYRCAQRDKTRQVRRILAMAAVKTTWVVSLLS